MLGFDSKDVFLFSVVFVFFWFWNGETKNFGILVIWMDTINQDLKKQKNASFFGFWDFSMQKPNHKWWKTKKHIEFFFEILIDRIHSNNQKKKQVFFCFSI